MLFGLAVLAGCRSKGERADCPLAGRILRLATTTSVDNTGLLAELTAAFRARTGIEVQVLAVGTGQALKLAELGDADVVLVHDPDAEQAFLAAGFGVNPRRVMHNDFVLVGPAGDPAGIRGGTDAAAALAKIAQRGAAFVSRGDRSGTHMAELRLWRAAGVQPAGEWYLEVGQGQRLMLTTASEKGAYALTDRATYLTARGQVALELLLEGDPRLLNPYTVMAVSPARQPKAAYLEAMAWIGFLTSAEGQALVGGFRPGGQQLFHPDAVPPPEPPAK